MATLGKAYVYRGAHPFRIESIWRGYDKFYHCRLNDGGLYLLYPSRNTPRLPSPGEELTNYDPDAVVYEGQSTKRRTPNRPAVAGS